MTRGLGGQSPANVTHHLKGVDFPASRADLEECAKSNGAKNDVLEVLPKKPGMENVAMSDVTKGIGEAE